MIKMNDTHMHYNPTSALDYAACVAACDAYWDWWPWMYDKCVAKCDDKYIKPHPQPVSQSKLKRIWASGVEEDICDYVVYEVIPAVCHDSATDLAMCRCFCMLYWDQGGDQVGLKEFIVDNVKNCCEGIRLKDILVVLPWL
jgi:hypothetical protein